MPKFAASTPEGAGRSWMRELIDKLNTAFGVQLDPDGKFEEWLTGFADGAGQMLLLMLAEEGPGAELLDRLSAARNAITTREQLYAAPTGTVIRARGDDYIVDHGPAGEWTGGRTHIYPLLPDWGRVFYPANFDLSLPVGAFPRLGTDTTERPIA